jgi:hypothetical protein
MSRTTYNLFLTLGAIWVIMGLVVYPNLAVWPLGFIFLIIGLIGKFGHKK